MQPPKQISQVQARTVQDILRKPDLPDLIRTTVDIRVRTNPALRPVVHEQTGNNTNTAHATSAQPTEIAQVVIEGLVLALDSHVQKRFPRTCCAQRVRKTADIVARDVDDARLGRVVAPAEAHVTQDVRLRRHRGVVADQDLAVVAVGCGNLHVLREVFAKRRRARADPQHVPVLAVGARRCQGLVVVEFCLQALGRCRELQ